MFLINGLYSAISRCDVKTAYNCFVRVWKDPHQRNQLKWRLPFIICALKYERVMVFEDLIKTSKLSGHTIWHLIYSLTLTRKSKDAHALATIMSRSDINILPTPELSKFIASLRKPFSNEFLATLASMPLKDEDYFLLRATDFLLNNRRSIGISDGVSITRHQTLTPDSELPWWVHTLDLTKFVDDTGLNISNIMLQDMYRFLEQEQAIVNLSIEPAPGYPISFGNSYLWLSLLDSICRGKLDFYKEVWQQYILCQIRGLE